MASVNAPGRESERRDTVKQVAAILAAIAPILTLLGTVITGYFTYLAAVSKGK